MTLKVEPNQNRMHDRSQFINLVDNRSDQEELVLSRESDPEDKDILIDTVENQNEEDMMEKGEKVEIYLQEDSKEDSTPKTKKDESMKWMKLAEKINR